jgi:hypothetical protein
MVERAERDGLCLPAADFRRSALLIWAPVALISLTKAAFLQKRSTSAGSTRSPPGAACAICSISAASLRALAL